MADGVSREFVFGVTLVRLERGCLVGAVRAEWVRSASTLDWGVDRLQSARR